MSLTDLAQIFGQFGPMGLFVGFLIWDRNSASKARIGYDRDRLEQDKDRLETDRAMAAALGALTAVIQRLDR